VDLIDVRGQIEREITWRLNEIRFLKNVGGYVTKSDERETYGRVVLIMLYAHYEGYCKTVLSIYAQAINGEALNCQDVNDVLVARAWKAVFADLNNTSKQSALFSRTLPNDTALHAICRNADFVANIQNLMLLPVNIPVDDIEKVGNLSFDVLVKLLYGLGLPHTLFDSQGQKIRELVGKRHSLAHGMSATGVPPAMVDQCEGLVRQIMESLRDEIMGALQNGLFRRIGVPTP
jgi:hypothetical protein